MTEDDINIDILDPSLEPRGYTPPRALEDFKKMSKDIMRGIQRMEENLDSGIKLSNAAIDSHARTMR